MTLHTNHSDSTPHSGSTPFSDASDTMHRFEESVRSQPLLAVGCAAGLGLLLAVALTKGRRPPPPLRRLQRWAGTDYRSADMHRLANRVEDAIDRSAQYAHRAGHDRLRDLPSTIAQLGQVASEWYAKTQTKVGEVANATASSAKDAASESIGKATTWFKK